MNILLNGICGHMGREVAKLASAGYRGATLAVGVDPNADGTEAPVSVKGFGEIIPLGNVDCIVDFSHHSCVSELLDFAEKNGIPTVVATTGHTHEEVERIRRASKNIPVFFSANMSLGVALLVELAKTAAAAMPDAEIEIIEKHHDRKIDAPSGTALMIADAICEVRPEAYTNLGRSGQGKRSADEIGIHAIRMGNIVGEHEVLIGTQNQTITLKHEAHSRALFAEGALAAAAFLVGCDAGLYDMKSLVGGTAKKDAEMSVR
ncbi:MAG: 4-hydroxy-tetrahydrodipicolinate reductase [Ruminococcaceae bacterium]|nr:4-hydroxy-tetrahydrodipicolinate reductase [Oscillospiraceae bacterium]